jgi:hypothetical protein
LPVTLLYGQFLSNPLVFDDLYFVESAKLDANMAQQVFFNLRWLPYASFQWTRDLIGPELIWFRLGNLALHLLTAITLFFLLRRLFQQALCHDGDGNETLSPHWLAFFGALLFSLHPASVYATAYLNQRSMLMATLFAVLTWRLFLEGLIRENYRWLLASAVTYLLAAFSKEHAIMTPAVSITLLFLVNGSSIRQRLMLIWPTLALYGLVGGCVIFLVKSQNILGQAYQPTAGTLMPLLGPEVNNEYAYPLSMLTESFLFFKYLWIWIVPSPEWMAVDMPQVFAQRLWSWPFWAGLTGFILYPILAIGLLLQRGLKGLLGFALLCPWLLFATELSTIRIVDTFVIYRSYLWMTCAFAALPFLCQKLSPKQAAISLTCVALFLMPLSWLRLTTFSHPLLLWDDAARLIEKTQETRLGIERIYYNRGSELIKVKHYTEAIEDLTKAVRLTTDKSYLAGPIYNNRGAAYIETRQYALALNDFNSAIKQGPNNPEPYLGKATALRALNNPAAAAHADQQACLLGITSACQKRNPINASPDAVK